MLTFGIVLGAGSFSSAQSVTQTQDLDTFFLPFSEAAQSVTIDLADYFSLEGYEGGTLVEMLSTLGTIHIELYDSDAPGTVENFLNYVNSDRYVDSIIHRSISGFVIQGGGFTFDGQSEIPQGIPLDSPISNEFTPENSNLRGTLSMAKLSNNPDSATSQFFINLADNSENLDNQNGGFTVFAEVVGQGLTTVDRIARVARWDFSEFFGPAFRDLPLIDYSLEEELGLSFFVRFLDVSAVNLFQSAESSGLLETQIQSISASPPATASLDGSLLQLEIPAGQTGRMQVTLDVRENGYEETNFLETELEISIGGLIADYEGNALWKLSTWFGEYYQQEDNWIYHSSLGWMFLNVIDAQGGVLLYTPLGWLWTREDIFPYFWKPGPRTEPGNWLYWAQETAAPAYFYDFAANSGADAWVVFESAGDI